MSVSKKTALIILAFFAVYTIWGSTYLLNKIAVSQLPPFFIAAVRFSSAGIIIFLIAMALRVDVKITKKQLLNTTISGMLFLALGNGLVVLSLKYINSGFAALEIAAQPLIVLLMMRVFQKKLISKMAYVGVFLGFVGVSLLVSQKQIMTQDHQLFGVLLIFFCMICWAYASIFVGKADLPSNYFVSTGYQMFISGIVLFFISWSINEAWTSPVSWDRNVQWVMVLLIVFGSIIAFTAFNFLLRNVSPEEVSTSTYVNPIVALILGSIVLDEQITLQSIIAALILLTGVYFINSKAVVKSEKP